MLKNAQSNRFINMLAIMLIALAVALGVTGKVINVSEITEPFEDLYHLLANNESYSTEYSTEIVPKDNSESFTHTLTNLAKQIPGLTWAQKIYISFKEAMLNLENSIAKFDNDFLIVVALLLLFAIKAIISFVPLSATCLISGLVFPFPIALLINFAGISLILAIKYWWGTKVGEGNISKLMKHSEFLWKYIQDTQIGDGKGNPLLLFILRIVPTVPISPISQMYGHMGFNFERFMLISLFGYSIKVVSFTMIGCNISEPFSKDFLIPLIVILAVSGISMLTLSIVLNRTEGHIKSK